MHRPIGMATNCQYTCTQTYYTLHINVAIDLLTRYWSVIREVGVQVLVHYIKGTVTISVN